MTRPSRARGNAASSACPSMPSDIQRVGPRGVPGVPDDLPADLQSQPDERPPDYSVVDVPSPRGHRPHDRRFPARHQLHDVDGEPPPHGGRPGEHHLHTLGQPRRGPRRPDHRQRFGPPRELSVEDQQRQPAEVVDMPMRHEHGADLTRVQPQPSQRDQARRPAVHQDRRLPVGSGQGVSSPSAKRRYRSAERRTAAAPSSVSARPQNPP